MCVLCTAIAKEANNEKGKIMGVSVCIKWMLSRRDWKNKANDDDVDDDSYEA